MGDPIEAAARALYDLDRSGLGPSWDNIQTADVQTIFRRKAHAALAAARANWRDDERRVDRAAAAIYEVTRPPSFPPFDNAHPEDQYEPRVMAQAALVAADSLGAPPVVFPAEPVEALAFYDPRFGYAFGRGVYGRRPRQWVRLGSRPAHPGAPLALESDSMPEKPPTSHAEPQKRAQAG